MDRKTSEAAKATRTRFARRVGVVGTAALLGACAMDSGSQTVPDETLAGNDAFVAVARDVSDSRAEAVEQVQQGISAAAPPVNQAPAKTGEFYLAINKAELGQRWFMSGYLKQYYPGGVAGGAAMSLGTRVVSFRIQNGKVYVFDADDRKRVSGTFDPQVVVDAYPIVTDYEPFNRLPNSNQYILVDPSAGLNDYDVVSDFYARGSAGQRFKVELSFLQRFRRIADGATFEEVFTGYSETADPSRQTGESDVPPLDTNAFRASGTLGVALRRYVEGDNFEQTPVALSPTGYDYFFRSDPRQIPNEGVIDQSSIKWNIRPGMKPIPWVISDQVVGVQQRYPQYDIIGALKAGIENWNEVFGFKVFEATIANTNQSFADDDVNYFIYDEDPSNGFAFADWRSNPNTGEVRGASVYYNSIWLTDADAMFEADFSPKLPQRVRKQVPMVRWKPMQASHLCTLEAPSFRSGFIPDAVPAGLTKKQKVEQFLTHIALHEIGHTLGLRHNFKGSLVPPSSSCMDYLDDPGSIARSHPGSYDTGALKYLYHLAPLMPEDPFCTDEELSLDTTCNTFDTTPDPLTGHYTPRYQAATTAALAGTPLSTAAENSRINGILQFVRTGDTSAIKATAFATAIGPVKVDAGRTPAPDAATAGRMDVWERRLLSRLLLDDVADRGNFTDNPDVEDPALGPALVAELKAVLQNGDKIRSYASRRTMVDILKKMQSSGAYRALSEAKGALTTSRPTTPADQVLDLDDLVARIDRAITPYYD